MSGAALAAAAEALAGCRFRLHGRDPSSGLDCVGVIAAALAATGRPAPLPNGYALRRRDGADLAAIAASCGFVPAGGDPEPGDVLAFAVGPNQFHLALRARSGRLVHAHAGLRRVVIADPPPDWRIAGHWRLPPQT